MLFVDFVFRLLKLEPNYPITQNILFLDFMEVKQNKFVMSCIWIIQ